MKNPNIINIEKTNEIALAKLRANYGNPATGYCEEAADTLRAKILNAPDTEGNINITNCEFGFLAGLWMANRRVRYCNAIEFWAGAKHSKVENCWFYQTYNTALT